MFVDGENKYQENNSPNNSNIENLIKNFDRETHSESDHKRKPEKSNSQKSFGIKREAKQKQALTLKDSLFQTLSDIIPNQNEESITDHPDSFQEKSLEPKRILPRKKRSVSIPRNIEVMVAADSDLVRTHTDVEHYVLTLMAIVSKTLICLCVAELAFLKLFILSGAIAS